MAPYPYIIKKVEKFIQEGDQTKPSKRQSKAIKRKQYKNFNSFLTFHDNKKKIYIVSYNRKVINNYNTTLR